METVVASRFFRGALTQLRIRLLPVPGVEGADKTVRATQPGSASWVLHCTPCRERACPFRVSRFYLHSPVGLTQQPYRQQRKGAIKKVP